jgi:hypothetical protein
MANIKHVLRVERGCGFRVEGGLYLMGAGATSPCPALPLPIPICKCCGQETIHFTRNIQKINPRKALESVTKKDIQCLFKTACHKAACDPPDKGWIMWVGSEYTMHSFALEAQKYGVSKRIPHFPDEMKRGDILDLGYNTVFSHMEGKKEVWEPGIFYITIVTDMQYILTKEEKEDPAEQEKRLVWLKERHITPVIEYGEGEEHGH